MNDLATKPVPIGTSLLDTGDPKLLPGFDVHKVRGNAAAFETAVGAPILAALRIGVVRSRGRRAAARGGLSMPLLRHRIKLVTPGAPVQAGALETPPAPVGVFADTDAYDPPEGSMTSVTARHRLPSADDASA